MRLVNLHCDMSSLIQVQVNSTERPQKIKLTKNRTLLHERKLFKLFIRLIVVVEQLY